MDSERLIRRSKVFGIRVIELVEKLPRSMAADVVARQLVKSATSVGANYRATCRARSKAEFISRMGVVEEEADESLHWLEVLSELKWAGANGVSDLLKEAKELTAIFTASGKTAKKRRMK